MFGTSLRIFPQPVPRILVQEAHGDIKAVAPPQHSSENALLNAWLVSLAMFSSSIVRTLVPRAATGARLSTSCP